MSQGDAAGETEKSLKKLINQRKGHRAFVTRILKQTEDLLHDLDESNRHKLSINKVIFIDKMQDLKTLDNEISGYIDDEGKIEEEIVGASEWRGHMQGMIVRIDAELKKEVKPLEQGGKDRSAKLPKLELKTFSGSPLEYQSFWDSFKAAIHQNQSLEEVTKFTYLRSFLEGPALSAINGLSLTASNYAEAISILEDRFGNKQVLISSNMDKLLSIPSVHSAEDVVKIRDVYNKIETCVRNLKSLRIEKQQYGPVLVSVVMEKIPEEIRLIISRAMPTDEEWNIDHFLDNLKREVESREMCYYMKGKRRSQTKPKSVVNEGVNDGDFTGSTLLTTANERTSNPHERKISCTYCRRNHASVKCDVITHIPARKAILRRKAKCYVCLRPGHIARQCTSSSKCFKCQQRHATSICKKTG